MTYEFAGRTLVLTGAAGGIGREIAKRFYRDGANLVLADRDNAALALLVKDLSFAPDRCATLAIDSALSEDCEVLVKLAVDRFGGIDYLVPGAAIYKFQPVDGMTDEQWRETMSINLDGVFYLIQRSLPYLREDSAIVNIASVAAHRGAFHNTHYSTTKGALLSLTRSLARELAPRTRVNSVSPGIIETPMTTELMRMRGADSIAQTPLKRFGQPSEIASVIAFLCSSDSSFMTGEDVSVNGGIHMAA